LDAALRDAAQAPLDGASAALVLLHAVDELLQVPNHYLTSDVGCAGEFASAALAACAYNVRINHRFMNDRAAAQPQLATLARYEREAAALIEKIRREAAVALR
jgi:formiminotetrahydrofolate cyclodeaminase